jgi:hypothetical protein
MEPMLYAKGICWIDDCRIPFVDEKDSNKACKNNLEQGIYNTPWISGYFKRKGSDVKGRFPANILVCDDMLNDGVISKSVKGRNDIGSSTYGGNSLLNSKTKMNNTDRGFNDKGSNSRYYDIDKWFDNLLEL